MEREDKYEMHSGCAERHSLLGADVGTDEGLEVPTSVSVCQTTLNLIEFAIVCTYLPQYCCAKKNSATHESLVKNEYKNQP